MTKTLKAIIFGVVAYIGTSVVIAIVAVVCMLWFMENVTTGRAIYRLLPHG